jgi:hypothetical protein
MGDFPSLMNAMYPSKMLSTWSDFGSHNNFEYISRLPELGIGLVLQFLNFSSGFISKLMIVLVFLLASVSFYICSTGLLRDKVKAQTVLSLASIVGSIFYAYNIWSFDRIGHWYFWLGYAVFPLFFFSLIFTFRKPRDLKYIFVAVVSWTLASSTPHMMIFFGIVFIGMLLFFVIKNLKKRKSLVQWVSGALLILGIYVLLNSYWIYPFVYGNIVYDLNANSDLFKIVVTEETTEMFSQGTTFWNVFRLVGDWTHVSEPIKEPSGSSPIYQVWLFASYLLPVTAFSALLSRTFFKYALIFSLIAVLGILLVMGNNVPFDLYSILLFKIPFFSYFNNIFRDPDKWAFLIGFAYSMLLTITSLQIINTFNKLRGRFALSTLFVCLILGSAAIYSYPIYSYSFNDKFEIVPFPEDIVNLNHYLRTIDGNKVLYIPFYQHGQETTWSKILPRETYELSTVKPNIGSYSLSSQNYFNYLASLITTNRTNNINDIITPFGTSTIVYVNDTNEEPFIDLFEKFLLLDGVKYIHNEGMFHVFNTGRNISLPLTIPEINIATAGGLDKLTSLNDLEFFNSSRTSLFFLDQDLRKEKSSITGNDTNIILTDNQYDLALSLVDKKFVVAPYELTTHNDPANLWSKAGAKDPLHGEFHPYIGELGIHNWDFDYGMGLVMTGAGGEELSVPFDVSSDGNYDIFLRYFESQKGGELRIYLDNKLISNIDTQDDRSSGFVWKNIYPSSNLKAGQHTLKLQSVVGLNAVNIFAVLPIDQTIMLMAKANLMADKTRNIYLLEGESDFYPMSMRNANYTYPLLFYAGSDNSDKKFSKKSEGTFPIPEGTDYMSLHLVANQNPRTTGSYNLTNLEIKSQKQRLDIVNPGFDSPSDVFPLINRSATSPTLSEGIWLNQDTDFQSVSEQTGKSVKVDVKKTNATDSAVLSTVFIPVKDSKHYYHLSFDVSARNVIQLHPKIEAFDEDMKQIQEYNIFEGLDGNFKKDISESIDFPIGTRYIKFHVLSRANPEESSSYSLDNFKLEETVPTDPFTNDFELFENRNSSNQKIFTTDNGLRTELGKENPGSNNIIRTQPFPVTENSVYNHTISVSGENISSLFAYASIGPEDLYSNRPLHAPDNSGYIPLGELRRDNSGYESDILTLYPGSEIYTELDILKSSNYTLALRAKECESCGVLNVSIRDHNGNSIIENARVSLVSNNNSQLNWTYLSGIYLSQGHHKVKIFSNSSTDLDSMILYSSAHRDHETLEEIFSPSTNNPAEVKEYKKVSPVKHIVNIRNATRPYILSFAESYDPLWTAYITHSGGNNIKTYDSIPLYSIINGFYIDALGNHTVTIEYRPQQWFVEGGVVGVCTIAILLAYYVIRRKGQLHEFRVALLSRLKRPHAG